ncbi:GcrA cell cycle regulator [Pacificimonas sp. WHA3]|uniref:GcrA cell cycle regulator n=1 Tax=Pacificimonas pallii TaxID=2827236 RepID=A0ABS6SHI5_9SPHN|nr:GcrA family cell cycle regulator [Pacificimonas pallii]MBV7257864.1 GcrA cell cycle regulator [Pacificimonas pallii]
MSWTDERIAILSRLWEEGHPASKIAEELGGVTRNAVIGKAHRLGLEKRPSPVKSDAGKKKAAAKPAPAKPKKAPAPKVKPPEPVKPVVAAPEIPAAAEPVVEVEDDEEEVVVAIDPKVPLSARSDVDQSTTAAPRIQIHDPRPAPRPAPKKPLRPARSSEAVKDKTSLLDLNERTCKWPIGHPGEAEFHFCGGKSEPGFPYCNAHCAVAYQAQQPRKDRPGRTPMPNLPRPR